MDDFARAHYQHFTSQRNGHFGRQWARSSSPLPVTAHFGKPVYFLQYILVFVQVPRPNGRLSPLHLLSVPFFLFSY
jgi:hypothetical protein